MKIPEMNNEQLLRNYACLLKQIENNYKSKKEFEEEMKLRFNENKFNKERIDLNEYDS